MPYTTFRLQISPHLDILNPDSGVFDDKYFRNSWQAENQNNEIEFVLYREKWYDHENEMRKISKNLPDNLFILDGEGDVAGDIWRKYFKAGKMQLWELEINPEPFDQTKLK